MVQPADIAGLESGQPPWPWHSQPPVAARPAWKKKKKKKSKASRRPKLERAVDAVLAAGHRTRRSWPAAAMPPWAVSAWVSWCLRPSKPATCETQIPLPRARRFKRHRSWLSTGSSGAGTSTVQTRLRSNIFRIAKESCRPWWKVTASCERAPHKAGDGPRPKKRA